MAENETASHCIVSQTRNNDNIESISESEKSNDSLRAGVGEPEDKQNLELSQTPNTCDDNAIENPPKPDVGEVKADETIALISEHLQPPIGNLENNEVTEPVPGSSSDSIKQESDDHTVWLPTSNIKTENEDTDDSKPPKSEEDEVSEEEMGEEEKLEEGSDAEMDDESDGGAYHLAEVSYGEENEDSQNAGGPDSDTILGMSHDFKIPPSPRLETNDGLSSITSEGQLASDFIIRRKNIKITDLKSGKVHYKNFECLLCGYKAPQRSSLLDHIHKHTGEKIHHCLHCDKKFRYKSYLSQHITIYHTDLAQFTCKLCGRRFVKESAFLRHERTHSGERPFPCDFCEYQARNRGALKEHVRIHTGEKPYECSECSYKCAYSTLLKRHFAKHHEEKTFACQCCNYTTKQLRNFNDHLKTHSGDKFYHCDNCSYKSIRKDSLKAHIVNVHSNESLSCTVCKAKFKYTKTLNKHMYAQHPEKFPFKCEHCNLRFKRPRGLSLHNRKRHSPEKK